MSLASRPGLRWTVPAGVAALVVGSAVAGPALAASADVDLPERSAAQLLTDLQTADVDAFSGTVAHHADLGLPALPAGMGGHEHSTDLSSLLDGDHELRVWASGHQARVALKGDLGEYGIVSDGEGVWTWSSDDSTATHLVLPEHDADDAARAQAWADRLPAVTPDQVTDMVLRALEPTTTVTTGPNGTVAGRPAYELVLEPTSPGTLIGAVRIAVDAEERVATRVQVVPAGSDTPALEVAFTELSFRTPDDSVFAFAPAEGVTVEERTLPHHDHDGAWGHALPDGTVPGTEPGTEPGSQPGDPGRDRVAVVGEGWSTVVAARAPDGVDVVGEIAGGEGDVAAFVGALPRVSGDWGSGRLLTSRLFSALLTDDGRLLVGAVDGDTLQTAAGDPAAALG